MSTILPTSGLPARPELLKVPELAALLKVKPRTIYEMVEQGRIRQHRRPYCSYCGQIVDEILRTYLFLKLDCANVSHRRLQILVAHQTHG